MEVFVARQPIFTKYKQVYGYELLYRNSLENKFPDINGETATTDVLINSYINIGIQQLSHGKPCFINFTEKLLQLKLPGYFQPNEIIVEILETVAITPQLIEICQELKNEGYRIALDDFVLQKDNPYSISLIKLADFLKVDFRQTTPQIRKLIEAIAHKFTVKLLAEKIETQAEYESAIAAGYEFFQGYFFSKPVVLTTRDVPEYMQNYFFIMQQLAADDPDLDSIVRLIEQDVSLSYKLLKLINSPAYLPKRKIQSIRQAVIRLGLKELEKWLYILTIRGNISHEDEWTAEIFINSLTRAKMCELIATQHHKLHGAASFFLTGMFSLMDVLIGMEMDDVLIMMPLHEDICAALKGEQNSLKKVLDLAISMEKGDWVNFNYWCQALQIEEKTALHYYQKAIKWAEGVI
ncbi:EAL and HDOD domain-containing protein [Bacillus rubiinfantis]|uniref:EAL and HDOD domain-containing protein n=1 Tax=Bacillus rubiinfantis TaxID=1499680 RepID=UPI0005AB737F|nr:HDOD domain-containing protein [Bacillus rubiinfantis]